MKILLKCYLATLLALSGSGCIYSIPTTPGAATAEPAATTSSTREAVTPVPTVTVTSTLEAATAIPTPDFSPTPLATTLPPPDFLKSARLNNIIFAPSSDTDCQLPCWQGLRIGVSTRADVLRVSQEFFGADSSFDIFAQTLATRTLLIDVEQIPDLEPGGYRWSHDHPVFGFGFYVLVDRETHLLRGIQIDYNTNNLYRVHSVRQIIKELGQPAAIYGRGEFTSFTTTDPDSRRMVDLLLVYRTGLVFDLHFRLFPKPVEGSAGQYYFDYCLDDDIDSGTDFITAPVDPALKDLDPVQATYLSPSITRDMASISATPLGITDDELYALAMQDGNACVKLKPQP